MFSIDDLDAGISGGFTAPASPTGAQTTPAVEPATGLHPLVPGSPVARALYLARSGEPVVMVDSPPGAGKPVHEDELVLMADGRRRRLGDIGVGDRVISHTGRSRKVLAVHRQGSIPTVRIGTESGRQIVAAPDHPFLTPQGWVEASQLRPGQALAAMAEPVAFDEQSSSLPAAAFRLAGYFVGDGSCSSGNAAIVQADAGVLDDVTACAEELGFAVRVGHDSRTKALTLRFRHPEGPKKAGGPRHWLREHGLWGKTAHTKTVPDFVFTGSKSQIAEFIGAYFSCDGYVQNPRGAGRTKPKATMYSASRELLEGVQHLLLRIGVDSYIREKYQKYRGAVFLGYALFLRSWDDVARFSETVPVAHTLRSERLAGWGVLSRSFRREYIPDAVDSISDAGMGSCVCLEVESDHTFVVADVVVHNSTLITQVVAHLNRGADMALAVITPTRRQAVDIALRIAAAVPERVTWLAIGNVKPDETPAGRAQDVAALGNPKFNRPGRATVMVSTIASMKMRRADVDLIIIDEAYQATFADTLAAVAGARQVMLVGDPGQIGPVVTIATAAWEGLPYAPHRRAPEVFGARDDAITVNLTKTYRFGPHTVRAIAPLYDFPFTSARPDRRVHGLDEVGSVRLYSCDGPRDMKMLGEVAVLAGSMVGRRLITDTGEWELTESDVAVVASHNAQVAIIKGHLAQASLHEITVGTADKLQGGQWEAVVALDPLTGATAVDSHSMSLGRLCVMCSRHRAHLTFVHDGRWRNLLDESDLDTDSRSRALSVRDVLTAL